MINKKYHFIQCFISLVIKAYFYYDILILISNIVLKFIIFQKSDNIELF